MYKYNRNFFESINTESQAYWAGLLPPMVMLEKIF